VLVWRVGGVEEWEGVVG
jgi:hypothetical protein